MTCGLLLTNIGDKQCFRHPRKSATVISSHHSITYSTANSPTTISHSAVLTVNPSLHQPTPPRLHQSVCTVKPFKLSRHLFTCHISTSFFFIPSLLCFHGQWRLEDEVREAERVVSSLGERGSGVVWRWIRRGFYAQMSPRAISSVITVMAKGYGNFFQLIQMKCNRSCVGLYGKKLTGL